MANNKRSSSKKKQSMSPTFKAGLIIILVFFGVWAVLESQGDAWYSNQEETLVEENQVEPIDVTNEDKSNEVTEVVVEPVEEEPVEKEAEETESEALEETAPVIQLPAEDLLNDSFDYMIDPMTFTDEAKSWSFKRTWDHIPVQGYNEGVSLETSDSLYIVETEEKVVYLTFDEGYEMGFTGQILDTLAANGVGAAFFVTEPYIHSQPELVTRMKEEGHIVANHSVSHYDGNTTVEKYSQLSVEDTIAELEGVATAMKEETGYPIDLFFRPPGGLFSERSLYITRQQGYRTVFWSMAYQDWYVDNQPGKEAAYDHVMGNYHPGAVILLHAVSESNTQALDDIIKDLKAEGYRFGSLYEIPSNF